MTTQFQLPPFPPPLPRLPEAAGVGAPVADASGASTLDGVEADRGRITTLRGQPAGDWAFGEISSPTVPVSNSLDLKMEVQDLDGKALPFSLFTIAQLEIAAPQLVAGDAVRLRIYRRGTRRNPLDLMAEYDGTSHTAGTWVASFSNQDLEYRDENRENTVWLQVRNTLGNSGPSSFTIRIHGSAFPARAP